MLAYVFVLTLLAPAFVSAQTAGIRECPGGEPLPQQVRVNGCAETPCQILLGNNLDMEIDFNSISDATTLTPEAYITILGVTILYDVPLSQDQLKDATLPLAANVNATYLFGMGDLKFPPYPMTVKVTLFDQDHDAEFCAEIDYQVYQNLEKGSGPAGTGTINA